MGVSPVLAVLALSAATAASPDGETARPVAEARWVAVESFALDGDPSEWTGPGRAPVVLSAEEQLVPLGEKAPAAHWAGPSDASLELWVGWTFEDLYLGGRVSDEVVQHQVQNWWRGDSLELFLNATDRAAEWGPDDYQVMLAPNWPERPWGVYARPGQLGAGASDGGFGGVEVACIQEPGGYRFEARIPWRNFGIVAREGLELPFNVALCDRDGRDAQDSYLTWTGEERVAQAADRRGTLVLGGPVPGDMRAAGRAEDEGPALRLWMPLLLAGLYALALTTRRVWIRPRARRWGIAVAGTLIGIAIVTLVGLRAARAEERESRRVELESYAGAFEELVRSGALGRPEPPDLARVARELMEGRTIAPVPRTRWVHLAPAGGELAAPERTVRRGMPFRRIQPAAEGDPDGVVIPPGASRALVPPTRSPADALQLVVRVRDERWLQAGVLPVPVLVAQPLLGEEPFGPEITLRHRLDLVLESEAFRERRGLEPALQDPGGRTGHLHSGAHLLDLPAPQEVDAIRITNIGGADGYAVEVVAAALCRFEPPEGVPADLRAKSEGGWEWAGWRTDFSADVTSLAGGAEVVPEAAPAGGVRVAREPAAEPVVLERRLGLGSEPVLRLRLRDLGAEVAASRWEVLPLVVVAALVPFVVTILAELLARNRRIRLKLAMGFAVSSAVPLLALTLLLDATLDQEHEKDERERVNGLVAHAERELERQLVGLEDRARMLLQVAELRSAQPARQAGSGVDTETGEHGAPEPRPAFPVSEEVLEAWWGPGDPDESRVLEQVDRDGVLRRVGSGPSWFELPQLEEARTGLVRPWGRLLACGIAETQSGAGIPMAALVAEPPRLPFEDESGLSFLGAGRDPAPRPTDLEAGLGEAQRRAVYGPRGELVGVLVAAGQERGEPVLADWSLTGLLVAAGLTAVFTVLLFAGILTGHIVRPIERLDRAVREGLRQDLPVHVRDEVGHLTSAIQSFAGELAHRVDQLEALQLAQQEMGGRLDADRARRAVLRFFEERTGARAWMVWSGTSGEAPRIHTAAGTGHTVPAAGVFLHMVQVAGEVLHLVDEPGLRALAPEERAIFGRERRLLALPLVAGGESRGAVVLGFDRAEEPPDLDFLRTVAAQAAVVLENAHLYHQAVNDPVTGFLSEPGFLQRLGEEIQRAQDTPRSGVLVVGIRLRGLPLDDERAAVRLGEAARRMRRAVRGLALFGRSGSADLRVALPWSGESPDPQAVSRRMVDGVGAAAWPDGEAIGRLSAACSSWPTDGPSARFVLAVLEERLERGQTWEQSPRPRERDRELPEGFVAESPLMTDLLETVRRIAEQEVTVLVSGETGTGKDRVAEMVHRWSPRSAGPLVHIHCPSLSEDLIEDELFGHEEGAFTGAHNRRMSPFEFAAGGTVVLDEVGGLSPAGQVALLRVLENREVLPLGASRVVPIDVRIVATTSLDLAREVDGGRFRRDLYFRLHIAQVSVPPLRLRRGDLPALVEHALAHFNATADRPVTSVAPEVLDALYERDWPGNLRELDNALSRALLLADGAELRPEHLDLEPEAPASSSEEAFNPRQREVLETLAVGARITSTELARRSGVSARTARRDLIGLVDAGYLDRVGARRGTHFRRTARA